MKVSRGTLIVNAVFFALLLWLYGGDLLDAFRIPSAEVAALTGPPNAVFAGVVLLLAVACLAATLWGALSGKGGEFKGYRLLPIVGVVAIFVDLFLISSEKLPVSSADQLAYGLSEFRSAVQAKSSERTGVLTDEAALREELARLPSPPYMIRGVRPQAYTLQVRYDCDGPVNDAPGAQAGTVIYCVSADRKKAWITAVALPIGEKFGSPTIFRRGDEVLFGAVDTTPVEVPPELLEQLRAMDAGLPAPQ